MKYYQRYQTLESTEDSKQDYVQVLADSLDYDQTPSAINTTLRQIRKIQSQYSGD